MPDHPDTLAKYCTAETAKKILSSQRLRWSAPHLFSDPFELHHQTQLTFDPHIMLDSVIRTATAMIFAREEPRGNSPLTTVVRRWRDEERFASPEEAEDVLKELMSKMVDQRQGVIDATMAEWRRFTRQLRICCFTAKPDNLTAWQRFGDSHRGAVIRFVSGEYSSLKEPQAVEYKSNRPEITSLKDQLSAILYNEQPPNEGFASKFLVKPPLSSTEQEWRCFYSAEKDASSRENNEALWFDDRPFERSEITSVYFGAFMPLVEKKALFELIQAQYGQAKVFQAQPIAGKYEIEFTRITRPG